MLSLICLAHLVHYSSGSCDWGYYPNSQGSCDKCDKACGDCTASGAHSCGQCHGDYSKIQGICMDDCPLGFSSNLNICEDKTLNKICFNLNFETFKNAVEETVRVEQTIISFFAGSSDDFYPEYDSYDPHPIEKRGFYFDGSAYFKGTDYRVTFGPVFTLALWVKPLSKDGYFFAKQNQSSIAIALKLSEWKPIFQFNLTTLNTFSSSTTITQNSWSFLMVKMTLDDYKAKVSITVNSNTVTSSVFSTFFTDLFSDFTLTFGAQYSSSQYSEFYNGFIWMFRFANQDLPSSTFVQSSGCSGCSLCPVDNSNACLSDCDFDQYLNNSSCFDCTEDCKTFGCVRGDLKCNLCKDQKCYECESFESICTSCISNAFFNNSTKLCQCNYNYIWDETVEVCRSCGMNCKTCDGGGYLGCSECFDDFFMHWGLCLSTCPTGYEKSGSQCVLKDSKRILDMKFNKIEGVVYDSNNSIPAVTGTSSVFYPDYESDDPIAAYRRGYYFNGTSLMNFAPYLNYTSPFLMFSPACYIGIWVKPEEGNGILLSSVNSTYSPLVVLFLNNSYPSISLYLVKASLNYEKVSTYNCQKSLTLNSWSYLVVKITLDKNERTFITCYINTVSSTSESIGQGHLSDTRRDNKMIAGTKQTSSSTYDSSYFKGFIYQIIVDVDLDNPNSGYSTSCESGCSACPVDKTCLSPCKINQYPSGTDLMSCSSCHQNCQKKGCINSNDTCNICADETCKVCNSYLNDSCLSYFCNETQYKKKGMTECKNCDSSCATCDGDGPMNCTSCSSNYFLLNGGCHSFCPTGYSSSNNKCTLKQYLIFQLNLLEIRAMVPEKIYDFSVIAGSDMMFYPDFDKNDPIPVIRRGHYFNGSSYLDLPPNSNSSEFPTLGNQFTFSIWFKSESDGILFSKQDSNFNTYIQIKILQNNKVKVEVKLDSLTSMTSSSSISSNWTYLTLTISYEYDSKTRSSLSLNNNPEFHTLGSGKYNDDQSTSCHLTIGAERSSSSFLNNWKGFLYSFNIFSLSKDPKEFSSSCNSETFSCSICPEDTNECLDTCPSTAWWNDSKCQDCQKCSYESCRRNDRSCNLCLDVQCEICHTFWSGSCDQCKENAELVDGECTCKDGFFWNNFEEKCLTCSGLVVEGNCAQACPTGFSVNGKKCEGKGELVFEVRLDKKISDRVVDSVRGIEIDAGFTSEFYPYYDFNDPYAGKDRGYYFNGVSSYMAFIDQSENSKELIFSPSFTVAFWVNPSTGGVIFSKRSSGAIWLQLDLTSDLNLTLTLKLSQYSTLKSSSSSNSLLKSTWNHMGFSLKSEDDTSTTLNFFINKLKSSKTSLGLTGFIDIFSSYTFTIGAAINSSYILTDFYTGYLHSFKVWNYEFDLLQEVKTSCSGCSFCPKDGVCLPSCSLHKFLSSTCKDCRGACTKGCVRAEDCNLCHDRLCEFCDDYSSTGCSKCVDGADFDSGICKCLNGTEKARTNGNLYCQSECSSNCLECFSLQNGDCSLCREGFFLDDGLCVFNCPSGKNIDGKKCVDKGKTKVVHFVFNKTINDPPDLIKGLKAFMGSTEKYLKEYDENDPIPVYKRGVFFDGNAKYVQLPKNPAETTEVFLGNLHSIKIWIRGQSKSSTGCICSKESDIQYFSLTLDSSLKPTVLYNVKNIYNNTIFSTFSSAGKTLSNDVWHELVIHFTRSGRSSTSKIFIDGEGFSSSYVLRSYFDEPSGMNFKLGYSALKGFSFKGFIYEFIIFNYLVTPTDPEDYNCYCELCTQEGDCLNNCQFDELILNKNCESCLDQCPFSCLDNEDCSLNPDPLCENYSGFEGKDCFECVKLAEITENGCKCGKFTVPSKYSCTCISQYEELQNKCVPCFYHLQRTDIDAYFSEDYMGIEFDMKVSVQSSSSSSCFELFEEESLNKLGKGATCQWKEGMKKLKVLLGDQATVVNGTEITFQINTLLTNIQQCGSNRGPISKSLYYKFPLPTIIPESLIDAPYDYYMFCGDLLISGSRSTGGYGRSLSFFWTFNSNPYLEVLTNSSDLSKADLLYSNKTLSPSKVLIFLTVTNWLGFNDSSSQTLEIHLGFGIQLTMDKDIKWKLTTQYSKSIFVSPDSLCKISDDVTYTWSLEKMTGNDSYFDADLFWPSQKTPSKLYIPKGSLGPGWYSFKLEVHDNQYDLDGKTFLNFLVFYSDLEVNFNPSYTTFNKQSDLVLNGDAARDPDNISENFEYFWTCFNGSDCSYLLSSQFVKDPLVSKENLNDFSEYLFNLTVSKGERIGFGVLTVLVNSSSKVSAFFEKPPVFVNFQENFVLRPQLDIECNCSFQWEVVEGIKFTINDSTSLHLGIEPFTLIEGEVYLAQLLVLDEAQGISVFRERFQADLPPRGGTFECWEFSDDGERVIYKLQATGWNDPKDSGLPLQYQFGFYHDGREKFFNVKNESSSYFTALPPITPLTLFVRVYDIYSCYSEETLNTTVKLFPITFDIILEDFERVISLTWSDPDILPSYMTYFSVILEEQLINSTQVEITFNHSLDAIEKMMSSFQDIDFSKLDILLNMAYLLGSFPLDPENKTSIYPLLSSFTELVSEYSILMSSKRGESYIEILQVSSDIQETLVNNEPSTLLQINEILKTLSLASSTTMGQSQSLSFGKTSIQVSLSLIRGDTLTRSFHLKSSSSVSIPGSLNLAFNSSETILMIFLVYNSEAGLYETSEEFSSAVEFALVKVKGEFAEYIEVDLKPEVLLLTIPVWNLDDSPKCVFWDLDSWSDKGCRLVEVDGNSSLCGCSHTSLYSAGSHFIQDQNDQNKGPIVIYISCVVAFLWLVLIAFFLVKDKKESESKIFVEKILAGLPLAGFKKSPRVRPNDVADQLGRFEKIEEKRDSNYVPAARIGIVGAYFDDKSKIDEKELEKIKGSELYSEVKSGVYEKAEILPFAKTPPLEELKVQSSPEKTLKPVIQSESVSILPSQNFEEMRKKNSKRMTALQRFEDYEKDSIPKPEPIEELNLDIKNQKHIQINENKGGIPRPLTLPPSNLSPKHFPKLPGLIPIEIDPDVDSKPEKSSNFSKPNPQGPQKPEMPEFERKSFNYEAAPTRTSSKNASFKKPQFSPIEINPNEDEGIELEDEERPKSKNEPVYVSKKFDYVVAEDIEEKHDSGEKAAGEPRQLLQVENKRPEEEKFENTELFTAPNSPRGANQFRRKKHEDQEIPNMLQMEERNYSPWVADYFFSAVLYYHEVFSRVARCTQGVASFLMQVLFIGLVLSGMGDQYAEDKGRRFDVKVANLEFQDVAVGFSMVILCNFFTSLLLVFIFRKVLISPYTFDSERNEFIKKNKKIEMVGLMVFSLIILGSVIGTGILEMMMVRDQSVLWAIILFIAFVIDFFLIQILKIAVYHYLTPGLILPSK